MIKVVGSLPPTVYIVNDSPNPSSNQPGIAGTSG
jgi:hypothetical protein